MAHEFNSSRGETLPKLHADQERMAVILGTALLLADCEALQTAWDRAPQLVLTESIGISLSQSKTELSVSRAAQCLAWYWSCRLNLMRNRCFDPLTKQDCESILLPCTPDRCVQSHQNAVVVVDHSARLNDEPQIQAMLFCAFHLAMQGDSARHSDYAITVVSKVKDSFASLVKSNSFSQLLEAFPIRQHFIVGVFEPTNEFYVSYGTLMASAFSTSLCQRTHLCHEAAYKSLENRLQLQYAPSESNLKPTAAMSPAIADTTLTTGGRAAKRRRNPQLDSFHPFARGNVDVSADGNVRNQQKVRPGLQFTRLKFHKKFGTKKTDPQNTDSYKEHNGSQNLTAVARERQEETQIKEAAEHPRVLDRFRPFVESDRKPPAREDPSVIETTNWLEATTEPGGLARAVAMADEPTEWASSAYQERKVPEQRLGTLTRMEPQYPFLARQQVLEELVAENELLSRQTALLREERHRREQPSGTCIPSSITKSVMQRIHQAHRKPADDSYSKHGAPSDDIQIVESDELLQDAVQAMEHSILMLPELDKRAYTEALRRCPQLLQFESDPIAFFRAANYDVVDAAQRLVDYWQVRKDLFGERAFFPMLQTGQANAALTRDDVVYLSCGSMARLPSDEDGRAVIATDRTRSLHRHDDAIRQIRALFYLLAVASEDVKNQTDGVVYVDSLISPRVMEVPPGSTERVVQVWKVMPVRLQAWHLVVCPPKSGKRHLVDGIVAQVTSIVQPAMGALAKLQISASATETLQQLVQYGLTEANLPALFGGAWRFEEYTKWQRARTQHELAEGRTERISARPNTWEGAASEKTKLSQKEKKDRKRKLNIIHSRQKRERRRAEADEMGNNCQELKLENQKLKAEHARLENLLKDAKAAVAKVENDKRDNNQHEREVSAGSKTAASAPSNDAKTPT